MKRRILIFGSIFTVVLLTFTLSLSVVYASSSLETGPGEKVEHEYLPTEGEWLFPGGYLDPENAWDGEILAYDDNTFTKATCRITAPYWVWTPWVEFTRGSFLCTYIGFYAWYDSEHCDEIDIDVYYNGDWHYVYRGSFADRQWVLQPVDYHVISRARVRFHVLRYEFPWFYVVADLHEFRFYGYP